MRDASQVYWKQENRNNYSPQISGWGHIGEYINWLDYVLWEHEVVGSSPASPTKKIFKISGANTKNSPIFASRSLTSWKFRKTSVKIKIICSVRLGVRTPDFHSGNRGSIPLRSTEIEKPRLSGYCPRPLMGHDLSGYQKTGSWAKEDDNSSK